MLEESLKKYRIYEYIRDNNNITAEISNSKKLILGLMAKNKEINDELLQKWIKTYLNREVVGG